jgi:hypothetical protein
MLRIVGDAQHLKSAPRRRHNQPPQLSYPSTLGPIDHRGDPRRQPSQLGDLAQQPRPGVRPDVIAVRGHFHPADRCATRHLKVPSHSDNGS